MSITGSGGVGAVTLDQLIALNDEMAALARAGVPLDRGLLAVGRDLRGRAGALASRLGQRIERGEGLSEALGADGPAVPEFYRAVVDAGLRAGKLPRALEGLAVYARSFAETRQAIRLACLYPLMVLILAYSLFLLFVVFVAPKLSAGFAAFRLTRLRSLALFDWLGSHLLYWAPILPLGMVCLLVWWMRSGRAVTLRPGRLTGLLRWVPGLGSILGLAQVGDFADLLALMIENGVPLDEGIVLSAEATGSPALRTSAKRIAEGLRRGETVADLLKADPGAVPPMLAWVLSTSGAGGPLAPALKHAAETYRQRARRRSEMLQTLLPTVLVCLVGSGAAILYTLAVFQPLTMLWHDLSIPIND